MSEILVLQPSTKRKMVSILRSSYSPKKSISVSTLEPPTSFKITDNLNSTNGNLHSIQPASSKCVLLNYPEYTESNSHKSISILHSSNNANILTAEKKNSESATCSKHSKIECSDDKSFDGSLISIQPDSKTIILNHPEHKAFVNPSINTRSNKTIYILNPSHNTNMLISEPNLIELPPKSICVSPELTDKNLNSNPPASSKPIILNCPEQNMPVSYLVDTNSNSNAVSIQMKHNPKILSTELQSCSTNENLSSLPPALSEAVILNHPGPGSFYNPLIYTHSYKEGDILILNSSHCQNISTNETLNSIQPVASETVILNHTKQTTVPNLLESPTCLKTSDILHSSDSPKISTESNSFYPLLHFKTSGRLESTNGNFSSLQPALAKNVILNHPEGSTFATPIINTNSYKAVSIPCSSNSTKTLTTKQNVFEPPTQSINFKIEYEDHLESSKKTLSDSQPIASNTVIMNHPEKNAFAVPLINTNSNSHKALPVASSFCNPKLMTADPTSYSTSINLINFQPTLSQSVILSLPGQGTFVSPLINTNNHKDIPVLNSSHNSKISTKGTNDFGAFINSMQIKTESKDHLDSSDGSSCGIQPALSQSVTLNLPGQATFVSPLINTNNHKDIPVLKSSHNSKISTDGTNDFGAFTNSIQIKTESEDHLDSSDGSSCGIQPIAPKTVILNLPEQTTFESPLIYTNSNSHEATSIPHSSHNSLILITGPPSYLNDGKLINIWPALPQAVILDHPGHSTFVSTLINKSSHKEKDVPILESSQSLKILTTEQNAFDPPIYIKTESEDHLESSNKSFSNIQPVSVNTVILSNPEKIFTSPLIYTNSNSQEAVSFLHSSHNPKILVTEPPSSSNNSNFIYNQTASAPTVILNHPGHGTFVSPVTNTNSYKDVPILHSPHCPKMSTDKTNTFGSPTHSVHIKTEPEDNLKSSDERLSGLQHIASETVLPNSSHQRSAETKNILAITNLENVVLNPTANLQLPPSMKFQTAAANSEDPVYLLPLELANLIQEGNFMDHSLSHTEIDELISSSIQPNVVQSNNIKLNDSTTIQEKDGLGTSSRKPTIQELLEPLQKYILGKRCLLCGFESKAKWSFQAKQHLITHLKNRDFKCDICDKTFTTPVNLSLHQASHSDEYPFACENCGQRFQHKQKLSHHMLKHRIHKKFCCPICDGEYKTSNSLKKHLRDHTGEEPYMCSICNTTFKTRQMLRNHSFQHNPEKLYKCTICDKGYNRKPYLAEHMHSHDNSPALKCRICEKTFNFKSNLAQHMLVHNDSRRHTCEVCNMKFKFPHHLKAHSYTHEKKKI